MTDLVNRFAGLPDTSDKSVSYAIDSGADTKLGKHFESLLSANPGKIGIYELQHGLDAFAARTVLARQAEQRIDAQYYMWHQDTVGRSLISELIDAADRGVQVRLLVDDMYGSDGEDVWLAMSQHPNIEVRLFAPYSRRQPKVLQYLTRFRDVNARMHTKSFTVDYQATIIGGRNIGDEYFDADPKLAFADNDVLVIGAPTRAVSGNFDDYWNSDYAYPVTALLTTAGNDDLKRLRDGLPGVQAEESMRYFEAVDHGHLANALRDRSLEFRWGEGEIVHDPWWKRDQQRPGWKESLLIAGLEPYLLESSEEIIMISPYFVPGQDTVDALCGLAGGGVRVRILTNSLASNDVAAVHAGYSKYRTTLVRCGIELYELNENLRNDQRKSFSWLPGLDKSSLHAKTMIFDRKKMFVGSFNYDQRSLYLNTEIGIVFEQREIAAKAAERFSEYINRVAFRVELADPEDGHNLTWTAVENGRAVRYASEPYAGFGSKLGARLLRVLPVDWLL